MNIYTLNVGQGQFVVVTSATEAFIVDTHLPLDPAVPIVNIKAALATALAGKNLVGLMITGFDSDHFNEIGLKIVLNKYRPNWIVYPRYFKNTGNADTCFGVIRQATHAKTHSISLGDNQKRHFNTFSNDFMFEMFSPHTEDMSSSNNCSLVCKVREVTTNKTYLVTGDTEIDRWNSIGRIFGSGIKCDVLAAGHHGSKNGVTRAALQHANPHTVLISAGVRNQYGHPDAEALNLYRTAAQKVHATNDNGGQSLRTEVTATSITTYTFAP
jgi:beta-lactamase superfamily II metal-dependent hydrolase